MIRKSGVLALLFFVLNPLIHSETGSIHVDQSELIFSGVQGFGSDPKSVTISNLSSNGVSGLRWDFEGGDADCFEVYFVKPFGLLTNESSSQYFTFSPPAGRSGALKTEARLVGEAGQVYASVDLFGLSAEGLEGPREPGLYLITDTVGLDIDLGWRSHHTHTRPELIGSEIAQQKFKKASAGPVVMNAIARYSPDFLLPFGYYRMEEGKAIITPIGTLAKRTVTSFQHNCLYPKLTSGSTIFDPGEEAFGVFTSSPSHVAYSEDSVNQSQEPKHIAHTVRVYPAVDRTGESIPNAYLICFEEATNGDYQDYVFLLENVVAVD